jgi:small acid-soluble spore protein O (minor)
MNILLRNRIMFFQNEILLTINGGDPMGKRKANHIIPGANNASAQGKGAGFNEEFSNEPLTEAQKLNNKKRKKNQ